MASAAASRPPPPPPPPPPSAAMQWLSPRVSFSLDDAGGRDASMAAGAGPGKASADFEFFLAGCSAVSTMLPADELFSGGKLVPLRIPTTSSTSSTADGTSSRPPLAPAPAQEQQPETPRAEEEVEATKDAAETTAEPKVVPARRWRDLLRMRKQQASSSSSSSSSTDTKPLRRLLRRGPKPPEQEPSLNHPLLRDPDEPEKAPAAAPTATPTPPPPSQQQHQLPPKIRLTAAQATAPPPPPPPPPPAVAADSPRLNAAGKVVFNGLGRSSSSPSSLAGGRRHRAGSGSGGMERSYSAHVRVTPVLNVPVCRKSVSVFGIDRLFSPSSASTAAAAKKGKVAKKEAVTAAPPPSSQ